MHHHTADLLLVEDDGVDAEVVGRALRGITSGEFRLHWVRSLGDALAYLREHQADIVLADLSLPDAKGLEAVGEILAVAPDCSLVVQTHSDDDEVPFDALRMGAQDYLRKDEISPALLERTIRYAIVRAQTRKELAHTQAQLDHADTDLDEFAHVVAHDLRGPVRTARLFADRLLHQLGDARSETTADFGRRLDDSLGRVDRMILSMLDYASLRGREAYPRPIPLRPLIEEAVETLAADLTDAGASVHIDGDAIVLAEPELLARVVMNVVANSAKYRRPEVPLEIDITIGRRAGDVVVTITDNGKGVQPHDAERAFRILERLDPACSDGLGFGLAICRRIMTSMGGSISFQPVPPPGAVIEMSIPPAPRDEMLAAIQSTSVDGGLPMAV